MSRDQECISFYLVWVVFILCCLYKGYCDFSIYLFIMPLFYSFIPYFFDFFIFGK